MSFLYQFFLLKSKYYTSSFKTNEKPLNGPNLSAKTTIYPISKYVRKSKIIVLPVCYITAEEARHTGVVCKNWHVAQPEVGINISLSDESDIIKFSVFCKADYSVHG